MRMKVADTADRGCGVAEGMGFQVWDNQIQLRLSMAAVTVFSHIRCRTL